MFYLFIPVSVIDATEKLADISSIYELFVFQQKQTDPLDAFKERLKSCVVCHQYMCRSFFVLLHSYVYYILPSIPICFVYCNY